MMGGDFRWPPYRADCRFVTDAAVAGAAGFGSLGGVNRGGGRKSFAAEPPPEITSIRLERDPIICIAPQVVEELLRAEGFTDIRYVNLTLEHVRRADSANMGLLSDLMARGEIDFARAFAPDHLLTLDAGAPITILGGLHIGCFEVFAKDDIRSIADLKGRSAGVVGSAAGDKPLLSIMASLIGLDPARDIRWVENASPEPVQLFTEGKVDAFLAIAPVLQEVRAKNIGHVIASSITDRPWSQYYCCLLGARTEFAHKYPVATKHLLRAILKGADLCVSQPARVAQLLVDNGYVARYDYALQGLKNDMRYDVWRDYDPEDSLRFYALRLHEAGLIKSSPNKLIADHTDWRFLNELKRELKV
jgi:NitT/TauT family transport system substrate-binding protein